MKVDIVILAAGQGNRMRSNLPKVLHPIAGKPMLEYVIGTAFDTQESIGQGSIYVVIGHEAQMVKETLSGHNVHWVLQDQQLGTGHAVKQALPNCSDADVVLILYGDVPLLSSSTLHSLVAACKGERIALLTTKKENPSGYGRIIRDELGHITNIVEDKDATVEQLMVNEVNTGIMAIPGNKIQKWIHQLDNHNAQSEYYLTDIIAISLAEKTSISNVQPLKPNEVYGINSRTQLIAMERFIQQKKAKKLLKSGVTVSDPNRIDIRGNLKTGMDVFIDINVIIEGDVHLEEGVVIEAGCIIKNSKIGKNSIVKAYSIIDESIVGDNCSIGPYARIRPGTCLNKNVSLGNFVEIKQSTIGISSKINHLSYIGDSVIGDNVNIGAGAITCNYDGKYKHKTLIQDNAFIGSNVALIAPVEVGKNSTIAAGSVITEFVSDNQLALGRAYQKNIDNWQRLTK